MTLILIWGFIVLLGLAVIFLFWLNFRQNRDVEDIQQLVQLEEKVVHLELHLKKSLEIMQDMAKKMHVQQEVLDKTIANIAALEQQNTELVKVLEIVVKNANKNI